MTTDRLRSIVPMFGGGTRYVETLDAILEMVETHYPTTDELVGWHREMFANVSSRDSIVRRVSYLEQVSFLEQANDHWRLGEAGTEYAQKYDTETLLQIMCDRNVGLRSLLYALSVGSMTITEISDQQLNTHPELGWRRGETDMALQRANWLRSMRLVQKRDEEYELTEEGRRFVDDAVEQWADSDWTPEADEAPTAGTYETVTHARAISEKWLATAVRDSPGIEYSLRGGRLPPWVTGCRSQGRPDDVPAKRGYSSVPTNELTPFPIPESVRIRRRPSSGIIATFISIYGPPPLAESEV